MSRARWRKSSRSGDNGGSCVEVATLAGGTIGVRDSKDPHGPALLFPTDAWTAFLTATSSR
ncbi:DUF397 domain-containing protein [Micromonospora sp. NBC_01813]|uniref:DUF397 domain-containing protein n=1 Tax=Micromonospora sp. NBC_01813 TaxID=2975988 RepID=UPI002DD8C526|nr:DUF397 domain-containing protein [Micromonospora sp. NBC_01813]WSA12885.1 DUF397 domain-containing protein [Micromonospora sp. NBC_01813]